MAKNVSLEKSKVREEKEKNPNSLPSGNLSHDQAILLGQIYKIILAYSSEKLSQSEVNGEGNAKKHYVQSEGHPKFLSRGQS